MGKYDPLRDHLRARGGRVVLTLDEVANLVGGLPRSAYTYLAWWNNDDDSHSQCRGWADAGFAADPDLAARIVTFIKR